MQQVTWAAPSRREGGSARGCVLAQDVTLEQDEAAAGTDGHFPPRLVPEVLCGIAHYLPGHLYGFTLRRGEMLQVGTLRVRRELAVVDVELVCRHGSSWHSRERSCLSAASAYE